MKETLFKPAIWHTSLSNLQKSIHFIKPGEDEESPGDALLGFITFEDGISLSLEIPFGTIIDKKYIELGNGVRAYAGEYEDVNSVFGFSQDGKWYVLKGIFISGHTESFPGFSTQRIEGNAFIISNNPVSDNPVVDRIDLELDGLTKWFRNFNITRKYEMEQDEEGNYSGCKKISHEYEPPESCILYHDENMTISVKQTGTEASGPVINPQVSLSVDSRLTVSYAKPVTLENAIQISVHPLRQLISILMGVFCSIEAIGGCSIKENTNIEYYAPFIKRERGVTNDEVMHMPFPFPEIEQSIAEIVERWFNLSSDAINAASIIVSRLDGSAMPCDLTFIACASAFEALSRIDANPERFDQKKFEACMSEALDAIDDNDFRDWLKNITYNRRSANSLANTLLKKLQPFSSYLLPDTKRFLRDHRVCGNAYVHRDGLESDAVLKDETLYFHTKAVWFLCYAAVLDLIGRRVRGRSLLTHSTPLDYSASDTRKPFDLADRKAGTLQHPELFVPVCFVVVRQRVHPALAENLGRDSKGLCIAHPLVAAR